MPARRTRALALAIAASLLIPAVAAAAPADVHVRVEGVTATLFDRVVRTDGRFVQSASDSALHRCDGTNNRANPTAGPTATGAAVDAMASLGLDFDGRWYGGFDDYFLTRFGPEDEGGDYWWGVLVNRRFTPVGGCQFRLRGGDEVLWVNDGFGSRPFLWLAAGGGGSGPVEVAVGAPLTVLVTATDSSTENDQTSGPPYAAAVVSGVTVSGAPTPAGAVTPGVSAADGSATVRFQQPGWQRVKARAGGVARSGRPAAIASNSLDVCVVATAAAVDCAGPPPSRQPVIPPAPPLPPADPPGPPAPGPGPGPVPPGPVPPSPPVADTTPLALDAPRIAFSGGSSSRVTVSWRIRRAGAGVRSWSVAAKPLGLAGARFAERARGTTATSAALRLGAGRTYALRFTLTDALGRSSDVDVGRVLVPIDDRAGVVQYIGRWTRTTSPAAWNRTLSSGPAGASLRVPLAAGRPVVLVRGTASARIELRAGGRSETFALGRGRAGQVRRIVGAARRRSGAVDLHVLRGSVSVDGVGVQP